jgi:hypothetical protein
MCISERGTWGSGALYLPGNTSRISLLLREELTGDWLFENNKSSLYAIVKLVIIGFRIYLTKWVVFRRALISENGRYIVWKRDSFSRATKKRENYFLSSITMRSNVVFPMLVTS